MKSKLVRDFILSLVLPIVAALIAMAIVQPAHAQTNPQTINSIDVSKLSPEQKTKLLGQVADLQKEANNPSNISESVRTEATKWVELGSNMGKAAAGAAKELGIAANDFVQTPLGRITMLVVVYKVVGGPLVHIGFGLLFLTITLTLALYLFTRKAYEEVEYEEVPVFFGMFRRSVMKKFTMDTSQREMYIWFSVWVLCVGLVISLVTLFTF